MANEKWLIDAAELYRKLEALAKRYYEQGRMEAAKDYSFIQTVLLSAPTVDAVEISTVDLWLREIAMNSMKMANPMDNPIPLVCAMLIERLDGLREFARERKDDHE